MTSTLALGTMLWPLLFLFYHKEVLQKRYLSQHSFGFSHAVSSWLQQTQENSSESLMILRNTRKTMDAQVDSEEPNRLSEELLKCLISIFLKMNQISEKEETTINTVTKNTLSCINPRGFTPKTTFNCKARSSFNTDKVPNIDPYGIISDSDGMLTDIGPYKKFIGITRHSLRASHFSDSNLVTRKLRYTLPPSDSR